MRYLLLTCIGMAMMFSSKAQDKMLTMEDAVLGYELRPKTRYIQWQGDRDIMTYTEGTDLVAEDVLKGEKKVLMTVEELNRLLTADLKGWPMYGWADAETLVIVRKGNRYEIDIVGKRVLRTLPLPKKGGNVTYNGYNAFAFTRHSIVFVQTDMLLIPVDNLYINYVGCRIPGNIGQVLLPTGIRSMSV